MIIRDGGFANHRQSRPEIIINLAAFIVLHFSLRQCYADVGEILIVPYATVVDGPQIADGIQIELIYVSRPYKAKLYSFLFQ